MPRALPAEIIDFAVTTAQPEALRPAADRIVSGDPRQSVTNVFADPTGQFFAGIWAGAPGCWQVRYSENEFCHLLEGRIRLVSESGRVCEFGPGASFVVPAGFAGTWEVLEPARKLYAVFESRN